MAGVRSPSRSTKRRFDAASLAALAVFALLLAFTALTRGVPLWLAVLYTGASALCFVLYAVDKAAAVNGRERIPESLLLWPGLVGGWPGAMLAQQWLRHKTAKWTFRLRFWLTVVANLALLAWLALPHRLGR